MTVRDGYTVRMDGHTTRRNGYVTRMEHNKAGCLCNKDREDIPFYLFTAGGGGGGGYVVLH